MFKAVHGFFLQFLIHVFHLTSLPSVLGSRTLGDLQLLAVKPNK